MSRPAVVTLSAAQVDAIIAQQTGVVPVPVPTPIFPPPTNPVTPNFPANAKVMVLSWQNPIAITTQSIGGLAFDDILIIQFTTGSVGTTNNLPSIVATEYSDPPSSRTGVLSIRPNDFGLQAAPFATSVGNTLTNIFAIAPGTSTGYPTLAQNTTYYVNIRNNVSGMGGYNMRIALQKPGDL